MATIAEKLAEIDKKRAQLVALAAKQTAAAKAKEIGAKRKLETRQRVLIGAFVLDTLKNKMMGAPVAEFSWEGHKLIDWLKRDSEREAFGLTPLNTKPTNSQAGEKQ